MCYFRYRKIPNDVCKGGFSPSGKKINLGKTCGQQDDGQISVEKVVQDVRKVLARVMICLVFFCSCVGFVSLY